jgi:hypothetical protein
MIKHIASSLRQFMRRVPGKITVYAGMVLLVCVLVYFFLPDTYLDGFLKGRITRALEEAYPAYSIQITGLHYRIMENRLECDSVTLMKVDSTFSCSVARFSVSGIGRSQLLWGGGVAPDNLVSSDLGAEDIVLTFPRSQYELRCDRLRISVPDSEIVIDAVDLHPLADDDQFFAGSKFCITRFHLVIPHCRVMGSACLGMLAGKIHCARIAQIQNVFLDVLVDKDKPPAIESSRPLMANELLSSIMKTIQLDSLDIMNGQLKYGERYSVGSKPALVTIDRMQILAEVSSKGIHHRDTVVIRAQGNFMQAGTMNVFMSIPIASPEFTLKYSGSLSGMDLSTLNQFLEVAEHKRIKTGSLQSASFDIHVIAGSAKGNLRASYKDLKIVSIDGRTGSESGVGNTIFSFISNNIKLRTTNLPDEHGSMKIGEIKYTRAHDDAFFQYAWFALRSGIGDIVGF